jgi:hypothetical protein
VRRGYKKALNCPRTARRPQTSGQLGTKVLGLQHGNEYARHVSWGTSALPFEGLERGALTSFESNLVRMSAGEMSAHKESSRDSIFVRFDFFFLRGVLNY